jgi:hypothetical protein
MAHDLIGNDRIPAVFEGGGLEALRPQFRLRSDNDLAQVALLRAGAGIGGMQAQLGARDRSLVPVLHRHVELPLKMWLVMHGDGHPGNDQELADLGDVHGWVPQQRKRASSNGSLRMRIHQIKCRTVCSALPGERAVYAARRVLRAFLTLWVGESGTMYRRFAH